MGINSQKKKRWSGKPEKPIREGRMCKGGRNEPPATPRPSGPPGATKPAPGKDLSRLERERQSLKDEKKQVERQLEQQHDKPPPDDQIKRAAGIPAQRNVLVAHGTVVVHKSEEQGIAWDCPECGARGDNYTKGLHRKLAGGVTVRMQCARCKKWGLVSRSTVEVFSDGRATQMIRQMLGGRGAPGVKVS